jgi:hypothetical protein
VELTGFTADGRAWALGPPLQLGLARSLEAPADALEVRLPWDGALPEFARVTAAVGGETVFSGIVDEQERACSGAGEVWMLRARSMAALLLDNEALPQNYERPALSLIFARHAAPYGLSCALGEATAPGTLRVEKGMSEWQVLAAFCRMALGEAPRVTPQGAVARAHDFAGAPAVLGTGGVPLMDISWNTCRCARYSELYARVQGGAYELCARDEDAVRRGIVRRRYFDAATRADAAARALSILREGRRAGLEVTATCAGARLFSPGVRARIVHPLYECGDLEITQVRWHVDADGDRTEIRLGKWEEEA